MSNDETAWVELDSDGEEVLQTPETPTKSAEVEPSEDEPIIIDHRVVHNLDDAPEHDPATEHGAEDGDDLSSKDDTDGFTEDYDEPLRDKPRKHPPVQRPQPQLNTSEKMLSGAVARVCGQTLLHPLEVVRTRMQIVGGGAGRLKLSTGIFAQAGKFLSDQ